MSSFWVLFIFPHEHYLEQWTCDWFDDHPHALIGETRGVIKQWGSRETGKIQFGKISTCLKSVKAWRNKGYWHLGGRNGSF